MAFCLVWQAQLFVHIQQWGCSNRACMSIGGSRMDSCGSDDPPPLSKLNQKVKKINNYFVFYIFNCRHVGRWSWCIRMNKLCMELKKMCSLFTWFKSTFYMILFKKVCLCILLINCLKKECPPHKMLDPPLQ